MDYLKQDLRFAARRLRKSPAFTIVAIVSLAIGIGANTAIFSLVNAVLLRDLPLERSEELVEVYRSVAGFSHATFSYPDFADVRRDANDVFVEMGVSRLALMQADVDGGVERLAGELVTGNFFQMLGVPAHLGRTLLPEDDVSEGGHTVVMISHGYWERRYAKDPDVVGREIRLNGRAYTIVGVAHPAYSGNLRGIMPDVFAPMMMVGHLQPSDVNELEARGNQSMFAKARLAPGVTLVQAQTAMDRLAASFREQYPRQWQADNKITLVAVDDVIMNPMIDKFITPAAGLLMGVVGLVLLIACANLASFLLAQAADRKKEIALRLAMGASRGRLIRQLLTESAMLAFMGGAAGLALSSAMLAALVKADLPLPLPITLDLSADTVVLTFSLLATLGAGTLFGLVPALQATKPDIAPTLKDEGTGGGKPNRFSLRNSLVVTQVAVSAAAPGRGGTVPQEPSGPRGGGPGVRVRGSGDHQPSNTTRQIHQRGNRALLPDL